MSSERSPQLAEVLRDAVAAGGLDMRVSMPARIVKVHVSGGNVVAVDCAPGVKDAYLDESDDRQVDTLPVIARVPVQFPAGGGYRLTFPVAVGDTVLLVFTDRSLDRWLTGDGTGAVDPEFDQAHQLTDAVALLGVRTFGAPLSSAPSDHATMGKDDGPQIHFRGSTITVGDEAGSKALALDGDAVPPTATMATWVAALTTFVNGLVPGTLVAPTGFGTVTGSATQGKAK